MGLSRSSYISYECALRIYGGVIRQAMKDYHLGKKRLRYWQKYVNSHKNTTDKIKYTKMALFRKYIADYYDAEGFLYERYRLEGILLYYGLKVNISLIRKVAQEGSYKDDLLINTKRGDLV